MTRRLVVTVIALEALLCAAAFAGFDNDVERWQACARYSARLSLAIFTLIAVADAYPRGVSARIIGPDRFAAMALNHGIHLVLLAIYVVVSQRFPPPTRLIGGMLGYALIIAMPILQHRHDAGRMTHNAWRRWTIGYLGYVGFVMLMSYVPRVFGDSSRFGGERNHFIGLFALVVCLGIWRVAVAVLTARGILRRHDGHDDPL